MPSVSNMAVCIFNTAMYMLLLRIISIICEMCQLYWCHHVRMEEVTLKDVRNVIGRRGKCRYHFQTQRSDHGILKKEVNRKYLEYHLSVPFLYNSGMIWHSILPTYLCLTAILQLNLGFSSVFFLHLFWKLTFGDE